MSKSVQQHFDRAASTFATQGAVQGEIALALMRLLPKEMTVRRAADLGAGCGFLTELLLRRFPSTEVEAIDLSPKMIETLRTRLAKSPHLRAEVGDAREFGKAGSYDLLASAAALQWMFPITETLSAWRRRLTTNGSLAIACMVHGTLGELHELRRELFPGKEAARELPKKQSLLTDFQKARLKIVNAFDADFTQTFDSAEELLLGIHRQGYTGGEYSLGKQPLSRGQLSVLCSEYDKRYRNTNGQVTALFRLVFALAKPS